MTNSQPMVLVTMGSDSDLPIMKEALRALEELGISFEVVVTSAHRSPQRTHELASQAQKRGVKVLIAGAGAAAHLAGVLAAASTLPIIGVPIASSPLQGFDALLATAQMPAGVPVATVAVGKAGAFNAGILAGQIIALYDEDVAARLFRYKESLAASVEEKNRRLGERLASTS